MSVIVHRPCADAAVGKRQAPASVSAAASARADRYRDVTRRKVTDESLVVVVIPGANSPGLAQSTRTVRPAQVESLRNTFCRAVCGSARTVCGLRGSTLKQGQPIVQLSAPALSQLITVESVKRGRQGEEKGSDSCG